HLLAELPQLPCQSFDFIGCRRLPPPRELFRFLLERQHAFYGLCGPAGKRAIARRLPFEFFIRSRNELLLVADEAEISTRSDELPCHLFNRGRAEDTAHLEIV